MYILNIVKIVLLSSIFTKPNFKIKKYSMRDFKLGFIFKPKYEMRDFLHPISCLHFRIIMKNQLIFVKSCIYIILSQ